MLLIVKSAILFKLFNTELKSIKSKYVKSEHRVSYRLEIGVTSYNFQEFINDVNSNLSNYTKCELLGLLGVNKIVLFNLSDFDKAECQIPFNIFLQIILSKIIFDGFSYSFSDLYSIKVLKLDNSYTIYDVTPNEKLEALNLVKLISLPGETFSVRINHKSDSYKDKILKNLNITDETRLYKGIDSVFSDNHYIELLKSGVLNVVKLNGDCCCINVPYSKGVTVLNYIDKTMGVNYIVNINRNELLNQSYLNNKKLIYSGSHGRVKLLAYNLHVNRDLHLMILLVSRISSNSSYILKTDYNELISIEKDVYLI